MCNDLEDGGLKMINMKNTQNTLLINWGRELLNSQSHVWEPLAKYILSPVGGCSAFKSKVSSSKSMKGLDKINSPFWKKSFNYLVG